MKIIDWNDAAQLGLLERINREILHPLGLAACRNSDTGASPYLIISDDGEWVFPDDMESKVISDDEVILKLSTMGK